MNRSGNRSGNRSRQRGFTLIELMVALLVSSLLVGMILAIFSRMSLAYRGQQQIAGVQQILASARAAIELDAKQAGLGMPQGFKTAFTSPQLQSPVQVINSSAGPDQIALFYADTSIQGLLIDASPTLTSAVQFDDVSAFIPGMLVVLTTASTAANPLSVANPDLATYDACALKLATVDVGRQQVTFDTTSPWGSSFAHCTTLVQNRTMMYRLVAHAYRIDQSRQRVSLGALQQSATGGLVSTDPWDDLAYGFSDIQTAVRIYDPSATVSDLDHDGDDRRNWYSGANQDAATRLDAGQSPPGAILLAMTISLVAHTDRSVEGIASARTPDLILPPTAANNPLGDRGFNLVPAAPPWPDPLVPGQAVYRWTTFRIAFRNLGVGVGP